MVRRSNEQRSFTRFPGVDMKALLEPEEMFDAGRLFARVTIAPGSSLAYHRHDDEMEGFYILKGTIRMSDNGTMVDLCEGDVLITPEGEAHAVFNETDEPVELIALIVSRKQGTAGTSVML